MLFTTLLTQPYTTVRTTTLFQNWGPAKKAGISVPNEPNCTVLSMLAYECLFGTRPLTCTFIEYLR